MYVYVCSMPGVKQYKRLGRGCGEKGGKGTDGSVMKHKQKLQHKSHRKKITVNKQKLILPLKSCAVLILPF